MKTIIIFYEHIARELEACESLKRELELIGDLDVYIYSLHFQIYDAMKLKKTKKIDMIIMPYVYKKSSLYPIGAFLNSNSRPYIVNFHHEQIGAEYNEERLFPIDNYSKNTVIHLVWTEEFKNKLIKKRSL